MIERILVILDNTPPSESALNIASSMAAINKAELLGVHIEDQARFEKVNIVAATLENLTGSPIVPTLRPPAEYLEEEEKIEKETVELHQKFQAAIDRAQIEGRFLSLRGNPIEIAAESARRVDFVIVGNDSAGASFYGHKLTELVQTLVHQAARPVLIVPHEPTGEERIVIAYDGSAPSERTLRAAAEFARSVDLDEAHLLTVSSDKAEAERIQSSAIDYLRAYDLDVTAVIVPGSPGEVIPEYANNLDTTILALGAFGASPLKERLFGSVTEKVLTHSAAAVLVCG